MNDVFFCRLCHLLVHSRVTYPTKIFRAVNRIQLLPSTLASTEIRKIRMFPSIIDTKPCSSLEPRGTPILMTSWQESLTNHLGIVWIISWNGGITEVS